VNLNFVAFRTTSTRPVPIRWPAGVRVLHPRSRPPNRRSARDPGRAVPQPRDDQCDELDALKVELPCRPHNSLGPADHRPARAAGRRDRRWPVRQDHRPRGAHWITCIGVAISLAISVQTLLAVLDGARFNATIYEWMTLGALKMEIGFLIDG